MDDRIMQFRVGVFFLATLLIGGILLVMFGKLPDYTGANYYITVRFTDAAGVSKDTPVRKSGILIGRVTDVQLVDKDSRVLVTAKINSSKHLYKNESCRIARNMISGDTALVFSSVAGKPGAGQQLEPYAVIDGVQAGDPADFMKDLKSPIETINNTANALGNAADQLGRAAGRVEAILNDETSKNIQLVFKNANASLQSINEILGDERNRAKLAEALERLPVTFDKIGSASDSMDEALQKFMQRGKDGQSAVDRIVTTAEMAEKAMRKFTSPTPDGAPSPTDQMANAISNINEVTNLLKTAMDHIENGDGTIGAFMKDRQFYDRLNCIAKNLEDITWKLKPIIDDARVISDKVARHPGILIRDAVKPGAGIK